MPSPQTAPQVQGVSTTMIRRHPYSYWFGATVVTQAMWAAVMGSVPQHTRFSPRHPMTNVSFGDALAFCRRLGPLWDIPTIHEWREMGMGVCVDRTTAWFNSYEVQPVAQKAPTVDGFFDMYGNVWQHCHGFTAEEPRICGGSVLQTALQCQSEIRIVSPYLRDPYTGFRLVYRGAIPGEQHDG